MGIKTVPHRPYNRDLAPCDFCLFPKLRGCRYKTIEMKEAVTKVINMLTQEEFHGVLKKLLERCNKCVAAGGDYFEGDKSFMCVLSIKVPIRKKSRSLFNDPRICRCLPPDRTWHKVNENNDNKYITVILKSKQTGVARKLISADYQILKDIFSKKKVRLICLQIRYFSVFCIDLC